MTYQLKIQIPNYLLHREHETLASAFREATRKNAQMLQTMLPREIRDMIYHEIFAQDEPIHIKQRQPPEHDQLGSAAMVGLTWPEDPSGYLSHGLVGKDTSREAAAIFYSTNTFVIEDIELLPIFLKQDCYGYNVRPSTHVQKLVLVLDNTPPVIWRSRSTSPPENVEYIEGPNLCNSESESEDSIDDKESNLWLRLRDKFRHNLEAIGDFKNLKDVVFEVKRRESSWRSPCDEKDWWDPRDIANEVFRLKQASINVTIRTARVPERLDKERYEVIWQDVSSYFDEPTVTDMKYFEKYGPNGDSRSVHAEVTANYDVTPILEWPCLNNKRNCGRHPGRDCTDRSWHAGWHRALVKDYWIKQQEFWDAFEKPVCSICEDNPQILEST